MSNRQNLHSEPINLVAVKFTHTDPALARVGSQVTVRFTVNGDVDRDLHIVDAIRPGRV